MGTELRRKYWSVSMTTQDGLNTGITGVDYDGCSEHQELPRGTALGRYVIIEPVGSGGMGAVYRAYDPDLNRGVALKILSVKHDDEQTAENAKIRLIREAQALARLSHPNVVAVHDVGSLNDDVFIAMEMVEGKTLKEWIQKEKKPINEILQVLTAAGRGLAAAHKAGLVHRDFKPGNVIIGDDGRVRVLDFGLARAVSNEGVDQDTETLPQPGQDEIQDSEDKLDSMEISSSSNPSLLHTELTRAGGMLGTPFYMAPEQYCGERTDERTDQFGFCVVLYEALYGKRPFEARTLDKLKSRVLKGLVANPPADTEVPDWLWQIIRKGLSVNPQERFPMLESLLEKLEKDPQQEREEERQARNRRILVISLIILTITVPIGVWYGLRYRTVQLCKAAEGEFDGVWDKETKASIQRAFLNTEAHYAPGTWKRIESNFERYQAAWMQMRNDVCEARLLRATQSEELFDLRMSCLQKRLRELRALVGVFSKADAKVLQKAVPASLSLVGIGICADEIAMRSPYPPPVTFEAKQKVSAINEKLAEVEALEKTGKFQEGLTLARKLEQEANTVNYKPVQAEVLFQIGDFLDNVGEYKTAETTLHEAAQIAGESRDGLLVARAMTSLVWVVGFKQARYQEGLSIARDTEFMLAVAGGNDKIQSLLYNNKGVVLLMKGEYEQALLNFRKSLQIREMVFGSAHPNVARSLNNIGVVLRQLGESEKAIMFYQKSLAIWEKTLGSDHPLLAESLSNLGFEFGNIGEHEKAHHYLGAALALWEKVFGPDHPYVAQSLNNIGGVYHNQGNYTEALANYRKSMAIWEKTLGPDHPNVMVALSVIGELFVDQGRPKQALDSLERVARFCQKKTCDMKSHGRALFNLGRALVTLRGDKLRAIRLSEQALDVFSQTPKAFAQDIEQVNSWIKKNRQK